LVAVASTFTATPHTLAAAEMGIWTVVLSAATFTSPLWVIGWASAEVAMAANENAATAPPTKILFLNINASS